MRSWTSTAWLLAIATSIGPVSTQTFTKCNPLTSTCPANPALGRSTDVDFTKGQSSEFSVQGSPSYDGNGANLVVAKAGDSPTLISNWFLMFGRVEVTMKPAPGVGIVSSLVLQSDDLDEIDFEWLGADNAQVQSNYFGKGQTTSYTRGAFHPNPSNQNDFHTYAVDWTADQVVWSIDGRTVRALPAGSAEPNQYPQTPMQLKLGIWSGGDSSNAPGTVQWAGGPTNYGGGPYTMVVKSVKATDYSTGKTYTYGDNSGAWKSIRSDGGQVNPSGSGGSGGSSAAVAPPPAPDAPQVTGVSSGAPAPFDPSHAGDSGTVSRPSVWPWVASSTLATATSPQTSLPGLPSGWTVSASGKVVPPSSASQTPPPAPSPSSSGSSPPPPAAAGPDGAAAGGAPADAGASSATITPPAGGSGAGGAGGAAAAPTTLQTAAAEDANRAPASTTTRPSPAVSTGAAAAPLRAGAGLALGAVAGAFLL